MSNDDSNENDDTMIRYDALFDALGEATREMITRRQPPDDVAAEIEACTDRLRELLCCDPAAWRSELEDERLDELDLIEWEDNALLRAAVLAALLSNGVAQA